MFANRKEVWGPAFGRLVREHREKSGETQQELAVRAFRGKESSKSRISELENGRVRKPSADIVGALSAALAITDDELQACRETKVPELQEAFWAELQMTESLVRALAWQFGHSNPRASMATYQQFLKDKADELKKLQKRIYSLSETESQISNQLAAAKDAIEVGKFGEVDDLLSAAEEMQQTEHTLDQVRKQVEIRETRGDAALLGGNYYAANEHYTTAANYFAPFDNLESANKRHSYAKKLCQYGERYDVGALQSAIDLIRINLEVFSERDHPLEWALSQDELGIAYSHLGERDKTQEGMHLLKLSVEMAKLSLRVYKKDSHVVAWARVQNNIGLKLRLLGERSIGELSNSWLRGSISAFESALEVYSIDTHPEEWGIVTNNLGVSLRLIASHESGNEARMTLLRRAINAHNEALLVRPKGTYRWALTQKCLGIAKEQLFSELNNKMYVVVLEESVEHLNEAVLIFDPDRESHNYKEVVCTLERARMKLESQSGFD